MASDRLVFRLYDYDTAGADDVVASVVFSIKNLLKVQDGGRFTWLNLYGAPIGYSGPATEQMNSNPEAASQWKGRILIHYQLKETKEPEMKIADIPPEILSQKVGEKLLLDTWYSKKPFQIIGEIGSAIALPDSKNYRIKISINDWSWTTPKPVEKKENYCRYSERFVIDKAEMPYLIEESIGEVFVYLMDGDDPICYWKGKSVEFFNPSPEFKWRPFTNDLSVNQVSE